MSKKQPFYKTGPLFYKPGAMSPLNTRTPGAYETAGGGTNESQTDAEALAAEYGRNTDLSLLDNDDTSTTTATDTVESATTKSNKLLGRDIAKGKGSGKLNRARRKLDKATMQSEGKSTADIRQTKAKSKRLETRAKMESLQKSGDKSQATKDKIARLDAKRGRLKKREARIEGRKAKKTAKANYKG